MMNSNQSYLKLRGCLIMQEILLPSSSRNLVTFVEQFELGLHANFITPTPN
jgi:hypothetical protein